MNSATKILCVDDLPQNLIALEHQISDLGAEIVRAGSGEEALEKLLHSDFALIILDVQMPGMDGYEVAELIRVNKRHRNTPIIFLTALSSEDHYVFKGYESGAVDFICKPFNPVILRSKVRVFVDLFGKSKLQRQLDQANFQRALEQAKASAAEASSLSKSAFIANMSHEIRTPLNAILGFAGLMLRKEDDPVQADRLNKIMYAGQHLLNVINDILDMSKIDSGKLELRRDDVDISQVVSGIVSQVAVIHPDRDLQITSTIDPRLPQYVYGDRMRLTQCILNYANNAVKFTERGSVHISASLGATDNGAVECRFEVSDTGIGIGADVLPRLFSAFEQANASTTRQFGGTGLGLVITKKLAQQMGGDAGATSVLGQGSTFWFTVRLPPSNGPKNPDLSAVEYEQRLLSDYGNTRILLAEDNRTNQEVLLGLLEDAGLSADVAENGEDAIAAVKAKSYDLILMDMQMPVMDGLDATRHIRRLPGYADTPILAMTANTFAEDVQACLDAGMNAHLSKPVLPDILYEAVWRALAAEAPPPHQDQGRANAESAAMTIDAIRRSFAGISGIDVDAGVKLARRIPDYIKSLRDYADHYQISMPTVRSLVQSNDWGNALVLVESLSEQSGILGLVSIESLALELCSDMQTQYQITKVMSHIALLEDRLQEVLSAIGTLPDRQNNPA